MPHFQSYDLVKWLHFACLATAGGAAVVAILLSGLEDDREDLRGLAATLWKQVVAWGFRLTVVFGLILLAMGLHRGDRPFDSRYFPLKMVLVALLLVMSEISPRSLALAKRGAPLIALLMFLLSTFVVINGNAFGHGSRPLPPPAEVSAGPAS
jgi:hypothetical protein